MRSTVINLTTGIDRDQFDNRDRSRLIEIDRDGPRLTEIDRDGLRFKSGLTNDRWARDRPRSAKDRPVNIGRSRSIICRETFRECGHFFNKSHQISCQPTIFFNEIHQKHSCSSFFGALPSNMWKMVIKILYPVEFTIRIIYRVCIRNVDCFSCLCNISNNTTAPGNNYFLIG